MMRPKLGLEPLCPACSGVNSQSIGKIPDNYHFCAQHFDVAINSGHLWECLECGLWYRYPCLSPEQLIDMYSQQPESVWSGEKGARLDILEIDAWLKTYAQSPRLICDIGCFNGDLLIYLRDHTYHDNDHICKPQLFGVEPSKAAARYSHGRGIEIVGTTVVDLRRSDRRFDLVLLVDVFEHTQDTKELFRNCRSVMTSGGYLVVVTGAADSGFNRFWKHNSYYIAMPEHVAFLTQKHANWLAQDSTMILKEFRLIRRNHMTDSAKLISLLRNLIFLALYSLPDGIQTNRMRIIERLRKLRGREVENWRNQEDHVLAVFQVV